MTNQDINDRIHEIIKANPSPDDSAISGVHVEIAANGGHRVHLNERTRSKEGAEWVEDVCERIYRDLTGDQGKVESGDTRRFVVPSSTV